MRALNVSRQRRDKFFYIMQDFRSVINCSAFYYRVSWRQRLDPSVMIAILLHDPADTDKAVAFIDREFDFVESVDLFVTHREREMRDYCSSMALNLALDHCSSPAAAIGNREDDDAYDNGADDDDVVDDEYVENDALIFCLIKL